ncbi:MAG: HIT family protein [Dehalococcoidales bacterium]|jgi:diadenosine tetraphosphate (Ap4A) HIT family hydrolase/predicted GNAT family N-acyltransferase
MLIRALSNEDIPAWLALAYESDEIVGKLIPDIDKFYEGFDDYMADKISQHEAFMAVDRVSGQCLGIIAFSQNNSRITFLAVTGGAGFQKVGGKLMEIALNQLDNTREITANILKSDEALIRQERTLYERFSFTEAVNPAIEVGVPALQMTRPAVAVPRPGSFHHNYANYIAWQDEKYCPICAGGDVGPPDTTVIKELTYSRVEASMLAAQGLLWGKCEVVCKKHYIELHDMPVHELVGYITDVQKVARVLKEVSGAVKMNLEMHGNTLPHLHTHLFPRYLDDPYAGQSIDYSKIFPQPYESKAEYDFFIEKMREKLSE